MKVAQILDKFLPLTESWIYSQIMGLQKLGVKSEAFCHKTVNSDEQPFEPIYSYKDLPMLIINYYRTKGRLLKQDGATLYWNNKIKKDKFDIIHSHFGWAAQKGIDLAINNSLPHIVTFYGADVTRDPYDPNKKAYQKKLPLIFKYSKEILCTSDFLKQELIKLGAPKNKITVWRPAIKVANMAGIKNETGNFKILSVGRFNNWKGQEFMIKALPKIIKEHPNTFVTFIGTGSKLDYCKNLSKKLNLNNNIKFIGAQKHADVFKYMLNSDLFVHASIKDNNGQCDTLGVVLAEAGLCSLPSITTNLGGMPEIVKHNITGYTIHERDYKDLTQKINYLISHKQVLKEFSNNALYYCKEMFDNNSQIQKLYKIIKTHAKD